MKNISKSYLKLFIKSWVETIGSILFLIIFTMITIGMLATPIQLSLRAISVKSQTNIWDNQMEKDFRYSEEFAKKFFLMKKIKMETIGSIVFYIKVSQLIL